MTQPFIAGDWGTTQLRLFLCDSSCVLDRRFGHGVRALSRSPAEEFAALTREWREQHRIERAYLTGMVGSRNGWVEVPYVPCPASLPEVQRALYRFATGGLDIAIAPGLSCKSPLGAPDVMRGEETQLFGALELLPSLTNGRQVVALPGTHTKWVELDEGRIVRFQTALTGELFALLTTQSTLLATGDDSRGAFDDSAFAAAVESSRAPIPLLHALFQIRSRQLLQGVPSDRAKAALSALLIGADVDGAIDLMNPTDVTLIGEPSLTSSYAQVLSARRIEATILEGSACALAGLRALAK
jgi:2-dehydro-3-deoxygalactonokinase